MAAHNQGNAAACVSLVIYVAERGGVPQSSSELWLHSDCHNAGWECRMSVKLLPQALPNQSNVCSGKAIHFSRARHFSFCRTLLYLPCVSHVQVLPLNDRIFLKCKMTQTLQHPNRVLTLVYLPPWFGVTPLEALC